MPTEMSEDWKRLAEAVIARRTDLRMPTRRHLGRATGLSYRLLGDLERGTRSVSEGTLAIIEQALGWVPGSARDVLAGGVPAVGAGPAVLGAHRPAITRGRGVSRSALHALSDGFRLATEMSEAGAAEHGARLLDVLVDIGATLMAQPSEGTALDGAMGGHAEPSRAVDTASFDTSDPTVLRMALGEFLRHSREDRGLDYSEVSDMLDCPTEFLRGLEAGRAAFEEHLVRWLLDIYGVDDPDVVSECVTLAGDARQSGWWTRNNELLPQWFETYVEHEQSADSIRTFEVTSLPRLLQTEEYARSVISMARVGNVDARVRSRLERQHVLFRAGATGLWAIIDEAVLRNLPGTPAAQREQLDHLIFMARKRNVTLQVLRGEVSARNSSNPFTLLRFGFSRVQRPDLVYLEDLTSAIYMDTSRDVELYAALWSRLCVAALAPRDSIQLLRQLSDELTGQPELVAAVRHHG